MSHAVKIRRTQDGVEKLCKKCDKWLLLKFYPKHKNGALGHDNRCRACLAEAKRIRHPRRFTDEQLREISIRNLAKASGKKRMAHYRLLFNVGGEWLPMPLVAQRLGVSTHAVKCRWHRGTLALEHREVA